MRLSRTFVRLPLRVDAERLAAEVDALDDAAWRAHPEAAPGNTAVPLVAVEGNPGDDATTGPMRPTPHLASLPYTVRVLHALRSTIGRTRLMRIEEEGLLDAHVDTNHYWWDRLRVHVPVRSEPDVRFECDGDVVHMAPGDVWVFDTWRPHRVVNPTGVPRIHLVVDTVGGEDLWSMIDGTDDHERTVDPDDPPEVTFTTELVNQPSVMSPWELEANLGAVVEDLARVDSVVATSLAQALQPVGRAWRDAWTRHGDAATGREEFLALRERAEALLDPLLGPVELDNGVAAADAIRQLVLRPAVAPRPPARARARRASSAQGPTTFERPVFLVSPPRSGSTLLFETLARSPDLATIGGESHLVIEGIPALHPANRDWTSNRLEEEDATTEVVDLLRARFAERLVDGDGVPVRGGTVRLLEKTPKNALRVPFLAEAFPDAAFVYLYRDPRETVSSMLEAWRSGRFVTYPQLPGWDGPPWSLVLTPGWQELSGLALAEIVTRQWAATTDALLDDLEALAPGRWCVASYDRLVADPHGEVTRLASFVGVDGEVNLPDDLPLSRHTLDSPHPDKWRRHADELQPAWDHAASVAERASAVFADPPRIRPVRPSASAPRRARPAVSGPSAFRSVHTRTFPGVLADLDGSLVVSTYQSGRIVLVRRDGDVVNTHLRSLPAPMGLALRHGRLAVGTKAEVVVFQDQPEVAPRLEGAGPVDTCFVPRRRHATGDVRVHDLAYAGDELWLVATRFSCLATLDEQHSFVPRWRPPFVSALAPEDRCHLNGLAVVDGTPRFVTALGATDARQGWRPGKLDGGVVIDVAADEVITAGLCMPHSPRWHDGRLWVLESGRGGLGTVDPATGRYEEVARLPGFTRGLAFAGGLAFVGLSQVRESVFDGLPLDADGRQCGVWIVDLEDGHTVGLLRFEGEVEEVYDLLVLPGARWPELVEPGAELVESTFQLPDSALAEVPADLRSD